MSVVEQATFLVSLFGMIGTVVAALAAYFSANTAKKSLERQEAQFKKSLEPLIVPKAMKYNKIVNFNDLDFIDSIWCEEGLEKINSRGTLEIPLLNLSNGIAKDIKIRTELIDYEEVVKAILSHEFEKMDKFEAELIEGFNKNIIKVDAETKISGKYAMFPVEKYIEQEILYLTNEGENFSVTIPEIFIVLQNFYIYLAHIEKIPNMLSPKLLFYIAYLDIAGNNYELQYIMKYNYISLSFENVNKVMEEARLEISFSINKY
ncbi:hypothetical protein [Metabacillus bambusae]|uniref:Uncharacterized protein n=1 Tax=Metabacillus bambusae TaxID=2795218 RepID=A0ABS3NC82_9BACI|nr:hypothetical protein [Metabacillus bambusae]MBO1515589.1 hypothetical protein [Metabacillus bambusae]